MIPSWLWAVTIAVVVLVYTLESIYAVRHPHVVPFKEAVTWVSIYVTAAISFGIGLWIFMGADLGLEFIAGYITELSLSVDNLFVFILIMASFAVPSMYVQMLLQLGIVGALVLRFIFILIGAAAIERFSWMFFIFGGFLIFTAFKLIFKHGERDKAEDSGLVNFLEKRLPITSEYHENKFSIKIDGKFMFTPMVIVVISLFMTDIVFALDSIPAIFGLTDEPYIVFTANAFALMGLRQMYFLLDGLLERLIYLSYGLAFILAFIGVKLTLHAIHEQGIDVPEISTMASLGVIIATLAITVVTSLRATRKVRAIPVAIGEELEEIKQYQAEKRNDK
jgi:tellurite resistance protein TerC